MTSFRQPFSRILFTVGYVFVALLVSAAFAWVPITDDSHVYVIKWYESPVPLELHLSNAKNFSDGHSEASAFAAAAAIWNDVTGTLQLTTTESGSGNVTNGNGRNEVAVADSVAGEAFPDHVLAVTLSYSDGNQRIESDIVFNRAVSWDSYRGLLREKMDFRRVAIHELGHLLGLDHPDEYGQIGAAAAIMYSRTSNRDTIQSDDILGAQGLYGVPGFVPPNDHFSAATDLSSTGTNAWSTLTTNIGASRQAGEPAHAEVSFGHSLWWRWTAPTDTPAHFSTDGSDFDTVLAVYTGEALSNLTLVAANDDEETPEQNPEPNRKRTSVVEFPATAGTTYHIAIDGWGDRERFPPGSTGQISFAATFGQFELLPSINQQPSDESILAGGTWPFRISFSGIPWPTVLWQWSPTGETWTDLEADIGGYAPLPEGGNYRYASNDGNLFISPQRSNEGNRFRCVLQNVHGSVISRVATLHVTLGPPPIINSGPSSATVPTGVAHFFTVSARDTLSYQWYHNGMPIDGATELTLWIPDPSLDDSGTYQLELINAGGSTFSPSVEFTVLPLPGITNLGSTHLPLSTGESTTLRSSVADPSATLQWYHDGRAIDGASSSDLMVQLQGQADTGAYWLAATTAAGTRHGSPFFVVWRNPAARLVAWPRSFDAGDPESVPISTPTLKIAGYGDERYVVKQNGTLGELSAVAPARRFTPEPSGIVDIAMTNAGAIALRADGTLVASDATVSIPVGLHDVVDISMAGGFAIALRSDGSLITWEPIYGRIDFDRLNRARGRVVEVSTSGNHAVALLESGQPVTFIGDIYSDAVNRVPTSLTNAIQIAAGISHTVALQSDGQIVAWGKNFNRELDRPTTVQDVAEIHAGRYYSVARLRNGQIIAWGGSSTFHPTQPPEPWSSPLGIAIQGDTTYFLVENDVGLLPSRLVNLSVRSRAGNGDQTLTLGFALKGDSPRLLTLARGIGPGLIPFGIEDAIADPALKLYTPGNPIPETNDDWGGDSSLQQHFASVGAFALPEASLDAVLATGVAPGAYTAQVATKSNATGIALVELYDLEKNSDTRLSNLSARTSVGTGENVLVAGFVIEGVAPVTLLVRAIGPSLAAFGLDPNQLLADPALTVRRGSETLATNDNWNGDPYLQAKFIQIGAFDLPDNTSKDAATVVTLDPGVYTITVTGIDDSTGVALVELYQLD